MNKEPCEKCGVTWADDPSYEGLECFVWAEDGAVHIHDGDQVYPVVFMVDWHSKETKDAKAAYCGFARVAEGQEARMFKFPNKRPVQ